MVVRNYLPVAGTWGGDVIVLELIEFLAHAGVVVEFVSLNHRPNEIPWVKLAPTFDNTVDVRAPSNQKVSSRLVRTSPVAWSIFTERYLASRLPTIASKCISKIRPASRIGKALGEFRVKEYSEIPTNSDVAFISREIKRFRPDVLIVDYAWLGSLFWKVQDLSRVLKIVLGHEAIHLRAAALTKAGMALDLPNWDCETEVQHLHAADVVLLETSEEVAAMSRLLCGKTVLSVPRGLPFKQRGIFRVKGRCLFVGSNAVPNVCGLRWFLTDVWPLVLRNIPFATLEVCGKVCELFKGESYPSVDFVGQVPTLAPNYEVAALCVMPLLAGSGFKTKLIEALSYGCACVSTPAGASGADAIVGEAVFVAQSPEDFAGSIVNVLKNDAVRIKMESAATIYAKENLTPDSTFRPLLDLIRSHLLRMNGKNS